MHILEITNSSKSKKTSSQNNIVSTNDKLKLLYLHVTNLMSNLYIKTHSEYNILDTDYRMVKCIKRIKQ